MIQSIYLKNMRIEKRFGGVYYICIIPIVIFDDRVRQFITSGGMPNLSEEGLTGQNIQCA